MELTMQQARSFIQDGLLDTQFASLYSSVEAGGEDSEVLDAQRRRYIMLLDALREIQGTDAREPRAYRLLSVPGRTELGGNHTDHNGGRVLAASVHLDIAAAAVSRTDGRVIVRSQGFDEISLNLADLNPRSEEEGSTAALIRGVASWFSQNGYAIGGFAASMHGLVPPGSGLSSSASFEVMIALIFSQLFNRGGTGTLSLALAGKYAENIHFGKPSGLMDQIACAHGGIVEIDFTNEETPEIHPLEYDFASRGYVLGIVNSGGSHADLTHEYAAVPAEMKAVARAMGAARLADVSELEFYRRLPRLRSDPAISDRALLRTMHFFRENARVDAMRRALERDRIREYLDLVRESGSSSMRFLQNLTAAGAVDEQNLAFTGGMVENRYGAGSVIRVHGGGFEGSMQFYADMEIAPELIQDLSALCGDLSVELLQIRSRGAVALTWERI
ncbi:galactokinase [Salinispira pacifica]|uniref:Galactokinase n=1 Tax=Salinispira pacifica TaxID=1307761 RepID=V5WJE8_9SPIO|nr:galactokinase family protein [Salinispira pacifica]AHC15952.1 Galactokinase [Salinispira pacifica]